MKVAHYKGAPLGKRVLIVCVCQRVRLYKFFSDPMQPFTILPS